MQDNLHEILIRLISGEPLKHIEKQTVYQWLKESEDHIQELNELQNIWFDAQCINHENKREIDQQWKRLLKVADKKKEEKQTLDLSNLSVKYRLYAAAIILLVTVGSIISTLLITGKKEQIADFQALDVPYGSKSKIAFSDGTVVWLNAGSKLSYPRVFNPSLREVYLEGEGFFDVEKDASRPFVVNTAGIRIEVLGTSFNVKSYPEDDEIEATLVSGKLSVSKNTGQMQTSGKGIILSPNQRAVYSKSDDKIVIGNTLSKTVGIAEDKLNKRDTGADTESIIAWKQERLVFKSESFENLALRLERWYNVKIIIKDEELKKYKFTGTFENETIEQALNALKLTSPFQYTINQNEIHIKKRE